MKQLLAVLLSMILVTSAVASGSESAAGKRKHGKKSETMEEALNELRQLKEAYAAQQQQIDQLRSQLADRDQSLHQTQQQLGSQQNAVQQAQSEAQQARSDAAQAAASTQGLQTTVAGLQTSSATMSQQLTGTEKRVKDLESPLAIHYRNITITPGGFLAAESVWRQHGTASDINTPFNSVPYPGAGNYPQTEFFGSGRQSRITLLAEGKLPFGRIGGYYETDWLSSGVTSNNNQSNSYTNRMRQLYAQVALNAGWTFTGGQMWSLATETKVGMDNRTEATPMTIDPQYSVGFTWARQYGFRVVKNFGNRFWLGASIENPQIIFAAHNQANNFDIGAPGTSGGLYNAFNGTYSFNKTPDFIIKAAAQPGIGHFEVFAILSPFRDRVYPNATLATPSAIGAYNDTHIGGGVGASARVSFNKKVDVGLKFVGGNGIGRYGTSTLPDTTVRPDGTLALLRSYQSLGTLEFHLTKIDIYANAGGEYVGRDYSLNSAGKDVGYGAPAFANYGCNTEAVPVATGTSGFNPGSPANCTADTRNIIEGTFGFWFKPYSGDRGRIQFGPQYSYVVRNAWSGAGATPGTSAQPHTIENMVLTSFRYYIP